MCVDNTSLPAVLVERNPEDDPTCGYFQQQWRRNKKQSQVRCSQCNQMMRSCKGTAKYACCDSCKNFKKMLPAGNKKSRPVPKKTRCQDPERDEAFYLEGAVLLPKRQQHHLQLQVTKYGMLQNMEKKLHRMQKLVCTTLDELNENLQAMQQKTSQASTDGQSLLCFLECHCKRKLLKKILQSMDEMKEVIKTSSLLPASFVKKQSQKVEEQYRRAFKLEQEFMLQQRENSQAAKPQTICTGKACAYIGDDTFLYVQGRTNWHSKLHQEAWTAYLGDIYHAHAHHRSSF